MLVADVTPQSVEHPISVFGRHLSKKEIHASSQQLPHFIRVHAEKTRQLAGTLSKFKFEDIEQFTEVALSNQAPRNERAICAWRVFAWYKVFNPFHHPNRQYSMKPGRLIDLIHEDADTLKLYAMFVRFEPDEEILKRLKVLNATIAMHYRIYATFWTVAKLEGYDLSWIIGWKDG